MKFGNEIFPTGTRRNNNVIMTSKRRRFDVMMTLSLRRVSTGMQGSRHIIVRRAGLLWSQQDFEWR